MVHTTPLLMPLIYYRYIVYIKCRCRSNEMKTVRSGLFLIAYITAMAPSLSSRTLQFDTRPRYFWLFTRGCPLTVHIISLQYAIQFRVSDNTGTYQSLIVGLIGATQFLSASPSTELHHQILSLSLVVDGVCVWEAMYVFARKLRGMYIYQGRFLVWGQESLY